jgi:hypothetical protein
MSVADRQVHDRMEQFQQPGAPIQITRLISTDLRDAATGAATEEPVGVADRPESM